MAKRNVTEVVKKEHDALIGALALLFDGAGSTIISQVICTYLAQHKLDATDLDYIATSSAALSTKAKTLTIAKAS